MEGLAIIIIFIGVMAITAVVFCAWALVSIARWVIGLFRPASKPAQFAQNMQTCNNFACRTDNPKQARFCRRCGKSLPSLLQTVTNRAAIF